MEMVDRRLEGAAKTLGASRREVLIRVIMPQIMPGVVNGAVLGFCKMSWRVRGNNNFCRGIYRE